MEKLNTDVLVIGSGGAGLRASIEASNNNADVLIVDKEKIGVSTSTRYHKHSPFSAFLAAISNTSPESRADVHIQEVMEAALGMANKELVEAVAFEAPERFRDLERWGLEFKKSDYGYIKRRTCFMKHKISNQLVDGESIIDTLKEVMNENVRKLENTFIIRLLVNENRCIGAIGLKEDGEIVLIKAKSVVLATGGASSIFFRSLSPPKIIGDGYILGLEAGAELANIEFIQIGFGTVAPKLGLLLAPDIWKCKLSIYNRGKEHFLEDYLPKDVSINDCLEARSMHYPFSSRGVSKWLDISIYKEIILGNGTDSGGIYVDFTENDIESETLNWLKIEKNIDAQKKPLELAPFAHAFNGGLVINRNCETCVSGLFAAGECVSGPHGADRPGGHMLAVCQVSGAKAGYQAGLRAKDKSIVEPDQEKINKIKSEISSLIEVNGDIPISKMKNELKKDAWKNLLLLRNEKKSRKMVEKIEEMKNRLPHTYNDEDSLFSFFEMKNMLEVAKIISKSTELRKESRGSHYREDYVNISKTWRKKIIWQKEGNRVKFRFSAL